jgi:hypothetical protein
MAGVAGGGRRSVVVARVALRAGHRGVCSRQGVVGIQRVVEGDGGPIRGAMAGVACGWKRNCDVIGIGGSRKICLVASVAVGRESCVVVVGMALCAQERSVGAGQWEYRRMVECGRGPVGGGVAQCAICRESGGNVGGIRRPIEIRLVASVAGGRQCCVVVVDVALCASHGNVCASEWERRGVVIESCAGPICRGMACSASCGKANSGMGRAGGAVVVRLVASVAVGRESCVVVVGMALCAQERSVGTGQWEYRRMVERGRGPVGRGVAKCAIRRESSGDVGGICRPIEVCLVASVAGRRQCCVVVVYVALRASDGDVRAREWERRRVVIESCAGPICRGVAGCASCGEANSGVGRAGGAVVVRLMASIATCGQSCVVVIHMALRT